MFLLSNRFFFFEYKWAVERSYRNCLFSNTQCKISKYSVKYFYQADLYNFILVFRLSFSIGTLMNLEHKKKSRFKRNISETTNDIFLTTGYISLTYLLKSVFCEFDDNVCLSRLIQFVNNMCVIRVNYEDRLIFFSVDLVNRLSFPIVR